VPEGGSRKGRRGQPPNLKKGLTNSPDCGIIITERERNKKIKEIKKMDKNYFVVDAFRVWDKFDSFADAENRFNELVNSGRYSYVELKNATQTDSYYYSSSVKIFSK
jgi:hypothetical protein